MGVKGLHIDEKPFKQFTKVEERIRDDSFANRIYLSTIVRRTEKNEKAYE